MWSMEDTLELAADSVVRLRMTLNRLSRQLNRSSAVVGMSPTHVAIFMAVARHGPIGLGRLAEIESVNATMLSRVVGKLEKAGLVERLADPKDKRCFLVNLTPEGRRRHAEIKEAKTRWLSDRLEELDPERAVLLLSALPALEDLAAVLRSESE
jgi:DNA-binding MarR family transcriptional regulator